MSPSHFAPRFVLLLLFALPVWAENRLWMEPLGPTTATPIVFWYSGFGCEEIRDVTRDGSTITIDFSSGPCSPPRLMPIRIALPEKTLPAGEYHVRVEGGEPSLHFVVRPVLETQPFIVRPSVALSVGGTPLLITSGDPELDRDVCPDLQCTVRIGGVTVDKIAAPGGITVLAPQHVGGLVDVTITRRDDTRTVAGALYYYDRAEYPLFSVFERILFPILGKMPGANGSLWRTEGYIENPNPFVIDNANYVIPIVCVTYPCAERMQAKSFEHFLGETYPRGVALLVPRAEAPLLSFALRGYDVSQDPDSLGNELPVVRERDMVHGGEAALLNVPLDPRYRVKLRVYAFDDTTDQTTGALVRVEDRITRPSRTHHVPMSRVCSGVECAQTPFYGELNVPSSSIPLRANFYVTAGRTRLTWAFASMTNNKTQQVTIVSANGAGGDPCPECAQ